MIQNYFIVAYRVLTRNRLVSIINVFGLALALSGSLLIAIFIDDELSYDTYHEKADRIYRVTRDYVRPDGSEIMHLGHLAAPFTPFLEADYPEIVESVRTAGPIDLSMTSENGNSQKIAFENIYAAEPSVFDIFSIDILAGDYQSLERPFTLMLSDHAALKYFGTTNILGKKLLAFKHVVEVVGIYKSFPSQSHWHPDLFLSFATLNDDQIFGAEKIRSNWEDNVFLTYIILTDGSDPVRLQRSFPAFIDKHMPSGNDPIKKSSSTHIFLQPLTSIHLYSQLDSEAEKNGNIKHVYAMASIGVFLIIIACFNFINLSTARATQRGKEVGLRKVSGALRQQLIMQYVSESLLVTSLSMIIAIALVSVYLPWLNSFTEKAIDLTSYISLHTATILLGFVFVIGTLAGIYPAFVISAFKPALILKGQAGLSKRGGAIRKGLVVVQFSISVILMVATLITYQQLQFMNSKDLGYSKDQVVTFQYADEARDHFDAFYQSLKEHPAILNVARSNSVPTLRLLSTNNASTGGEEINMKNVSIDQHFFETYDIPFISGKNYPSDMKSNLSFEEKSRYGFILNESACKTLGWTPEQAIGKELTNGGVKSTITGVVKDFHFESLHEPIVPIIFINYANYSQLSVLISTSKMKEGIAHLEKTWKQFVTQDSFKYDFLSDRYSRLYEGEAKQQELFFIFAVLAIFIASLGLFGLATFNAIQRSKEVSIRKVLGASVLSVLRLLGKEIVLLIVVANAIAWPAAWYLMTQWLSGFAYHIDMNILTYIIVGVTSLLLTMVTIASQTIKAALTNPARMLRSE